MNSNVILYQGVKLDKNNLHNLTNQQLMTQLQSNILKQFTDLSIVVENYTLRLPAKYGETFTANYMAFQNPTYNNKWFFAWVDKIEYISNLTIQVDFTIDYWSTYFQDLTLLDCFVERETVSDDTIGANTLDENLDVGRISCLETIKDAGLGEYFFIGMFTNYDPNADTTTSSSIVIYNRIVYGQGIKLFLIQDITDFSNVTEFIRILNGSQNATIEDIKDIFIIPYSAINMTDLSSVNFGTDDAFVYYLMSSKLEPKTYTTSIVKPYAITGRYQPRNNKCYCYPYNFLQVTNNCGNIKNFKYEEFATTTADFDTEIALTIGMSIRCVPLSYENETRNYNEQLPLGKYPTCSWSADSYINWLTQNSVNLEQKILNSGVNVVNKLSSINTADAGILAGVNSAMDLIGDFKQASMLPDSVHGTNNGDINWSSTYNTFCYKKMRCEDEYLKIIDEYFTKYGYKINRVKLPNITSRTYFNYLKIANGEKLATGNVPLLALNEINQIAQNGVTIWHNVGNIGDYTLNNTIIGG